jgi:ATP-dependent DNA helicase RecG
VAQRGEVVTHRMARDGFASPKMCGCVAPARVLGTRQSGLPALRLADLASHDELVPIAHDDARLILERDPHLEGEAGRTLRTLLYLFRRDEAVQYLRAG